MNKFLLLSTDMIIYLTLTVAGLVIIGFLGRLWWAFDIFSSFQLQYFIYFLFATIFFLTIGNYRYVGIAALFVLITGILIFPIYFKNKAGSGIEIAQSLKILSFNMQRSADADQFINYMKGEDPDLIVLSEITKATYGAVQNNAPEYNIHLLGEAGKEASNIAIFSRIPETKLVVDYFGSGKRPSIRVEFMAGQQTTVLYGIHPTIPFRYKAYTSFYNEFIQRVAQEKGKVIIVGDFNMTPWSQNFRYLLSKTHLKDSRSGAGLGLSWPTIFPAFMRLPLDHVLTSQDITIQNRTLGPKMGSDHFPLVTELGL